MIWISVLFLLAGLLLLTLGGDKLVDGAVLVARKFGMSPSLAGLTIVAMGTSAPEFVVSLMAAYEGNSDIAVANVVGSNIFNIAGVLGVCALILPLAVSRHALLEDWPPLLLASVISYLLFLDGKISHGDGAIFLFLFAVSTGWTIYREKVRARSLQETDEEAQARETLSLFKPSLMVIGGSLALVLGAKWMLQGAIDLARYFQLSERVIGLTIIAAGTGMPEFAASLAASIKRYDSVAIGNIIGSCVFNLLWILGAAALLQEMNVSAELIHVDTVIMISLSVLLLFFMWTHRKIGRIEGLIFFLIYCAYIVSLLERKPVPLN